MSQWYYAHDGKQSGPVPISELQRLAANGQFDPEKDLVWQEGLPDWKPASTVPELSSLIPGATPPAATAAPTGAAPAGPSPYQSPSTPSPQPTGPAPMSNLPPSNGLAIASLVCGLVAFLSCFLWCLSMPLAIAAIVTGHMASYKIRQDPARFTGKGLSRTGLITGYLGLILSVVFILIVNSMMSMTPDELREMGVPDELIEQFESQQQLRERIIEEQSQ
ncbi:GYF domain-containing protein [Haloferula sp.]|uniref:GYF domain-containing protein n=1 Tax=Haloferula sp. TaxID=2497595 RepID=UPI003C7216DD